MVHGFLLSCGMYFYCAAGAVNVDSNIFPVLAENAIALSELTMRYFAMLSHIVCFVMKASLACILCCLLLSIATADK